MEHIKINGKHVDVEDVPAPTTYQPHPFDNHPVMSHFEESAGKRTPERDKEYLTARDALASSPHLDKYFASQEAREKANPDAYKARGTNRAQPVHKQVDPLDISKESAEQVSTPQAKSKVDKPTTELTAEERAKAIALLPPDLRAKLGL
jgi:hypothetical protein